MNIESVPVPEFDPSDILVRVRAASICGTDLHIYHWDRWSASRLNPPVTTGHENGVITVNIAEGHKVFLNWRSLR